LILLEKRGSEEREREGERGREGGGGEEKEERDVFILKARKAV
jgi:hypothetical protein